MARSSTRFLLSLVGVTTLISILAGCGETELACSTNESRALVAQIALKQLKKVVAPDESTDLDKTEFTLKDVITIDKGKLKTKCKATLTMKVVYTKPTQTDAVPEADLPITYDVERTDDGRLYITVFGL